MAKAMARFSIDASNMVKKLTPLLDQMDPIMPAIATAMEGLEQMNEGKDWNNRTPPIKTGALRGSSYTTLDGRVMDTYDKETARERHIVGKGRQEPGKLNIAWVWSAHYAATMHEWRRGWGARTRAQKDAGARWVSVTLMHNAKKIVALFGMLLNPNNIKKLRAEYRLARKMRGTVGDDFKAPSWLKYF